MRYQATRKQIQEIEKALDKIIQEAEEEGEAAFVDYCDDCECDVCPISLEIDLQCGMCGEPYNAEQWKAIKAIWQGFMKYDCKVVEK